MKIVLWLWEHFLLASMVVGSVAIVLRALDAVVELGIKRWPGSHILIYIDRALDGADGVLGFLVKILDQLAMNRARTTVP